MQDLLFLFCFAFLSMCLCNEGKNYSSKFHNGFVISSFLRQSFFNNNKKNMWDIWHFTRSFLSKNCACVRRCACFYVHFKNIQCTDVYTKQTEILCVVSELNLEDGGVFIVQHTIKQCQVIPAHRLVFLMNMRAWCCI